MRAMLSRKKKKDTPVPLPPEKMKEVNLVPERGFFKNLSASSIRRHERIEEGRSALPRHIWWGVLGLIILFVGGFAVSFFLLRQKVSRTLSDQADLFRAGVAALTSGNPVLAEQKFSLLSEDANGLGSLAGWLDFLYQGGAGTVTAFTDVTRQFIQLSQQIATLEQDVFGIWQGSSGPEFVSHLKLLRSTLAAINTDAGKISSGLPLFGSMLAQGGNYLALQTQSEITQKFLDAFIPWISSSSPHHILVMLQNPSELRPTGGFLGSYADVTIENGAVTNVSVHDVTDVDATFAPKIVPPKPLQLEVVRWLPDNANWFFDFPTSASKTLAFFNESGLYMASGTALSASSSPAASSAAPYFDAAIAVSPKVIQDLLSVTGPITVSSTKTAFTSSNFMPEIQKIVQAGQASSATYPKKILRDLMTQLSAKLSSLTEAEKQAIIGMAESWVGERDIMAYASNPDIESFLKTVGAAGDVYALPQNFNGDYLAVVDANVNGGKSDYAVTENITWSDQIGADGTMTDNLLIDRKNGANTSPYWWYRVKNQVYLQIFVPPDGMLTNESGGVSLRIVPKTNYAANGYTTDPLVSSLEAGAQPLFSYPAVTEHQENGKMVFATWSVVGPGAETKLSFEYAHQAFTPPAPGVAYQFVFERQPGTNRNYSFEVDAPLGYEFAETNLPSWTYQSSTMPGRMVVDLTLEKIPGSQQ